MIKDLLKDGDKWSLGRMMAVIQFGFMMYNYPEMNEYQVWIFLINLGYIKATQWLTKGQEK